MGTGYRKWSATPRRTSIPYLLQFFLNLEGTYKERTAHRIFHFPEIDEHIVLGENLTTGWTGRHAATQCSVRSRPVDYRFNSRQTCEYSTSWRPWPRGGSQLLPRPRPTARDNSVPPACLRHHVTGWSSLFTSQPVLSVVGLFPVIRSVIVGGRIRACAGYYKQT